MTADEQKTVSSLHRPGQWLTLLVLRSFIPDFKKTESHKVRTAYGYLEGWVSIVVNIVLFIIKLVFGLILNSISLIADSFHTLADVLTSVIVVASFWVAHRPADEKHPYGHGRFETIATLIIAILLIIIGAEFFWSSIQRLIQPQIVKGTITVVLVILFSAVLKEWLAQFAVYLGKRIKAAVLLADAWHHRSDAIASTLVAIAIIAAIYSYHQVDSIFGMLVSGLIIYTGFDLGRSAVSFLMGEAPSDELVAKICDIARSVDGVKDTHKVTVHDYGNHRSVMLHVQVDKHLSVHESHEIASQIKQKISDSLDGFSAEVHIEPQIQKTEVRRKKPDKNSM